ncbi:hypothetical protein BMETH_2170_0 [methanotrophic bacterial endosymbiont of Bathymodiolus sp.]|nr:hypothetical protein BMETH_2170_0 [methanotrophic bacterial endosymbiont of Bathymodiolus sp.]
MLKNHACGYHLCNLGGSGYCVSRYCRCNRLSGNSRYCGDHRDVFDYCRRGGYPCV